MAAPMREGAPAGGARPAPHAHPANFEYDDNEWDIGIGDLIIDLDADIEKTDEAGGMAARAEPDAQRTALKMKIKRTKPGTKSSEAKHEIVKSNEMNGEMKPQTATAATPPAAAKRGSGGHRRDKARDKHHHPHPPHDVNGVPRVPPPPNAPGPPAPAPASLTPAASPQPAPNKQEPRPTPAPRLEAKPPAPAPQPPAAPPPASAPAPAPAPAPPAHPTHAPAPAHKSGSVQFIPCGTIKKQMQIAFQEKQDAVKWMRTTDVKTAEKRDRLSRRQYKNNKEMSHQTTLFHGATGHSKSVCILQDEHACLKRKEGGIRKI
ncbi:unnamed protein product [Chilo suppressalis]|uniref:WH2 domain-containing protein n=1 Tax=Chilo suppressalis TaxID=168631 RepID=A0ABN8B6N2_CHISP|nr:unnamed protein product [Chilo suppressalis]